MSDQCRGSGYKLCHVLYMWRKKIKLGGDYKWLVNMLTQNINILYLNITHMQYNKIHKSTNMHRLTY